MNTYHLNCKFPDFQEYSMSHNYHFITFQWEKISWQSFQSGHDRRPAVSFSLVSFIASRLIYTMSGVRIERPLSAAYLEHLETEFIREYLAA